MSHTPFPHISQFNSLFSFFLEQAQSELGVAPRDYLPVTYESEGSLGGALLSVAPTLLLIGFWLLMTRAGGGGALGGRGGGGGGGMGGGIFQVGKSKVTIISKEKKTGVTFKVLLFLHHPFFPICRTPLSPISQN